MLGGNMTDTLLGSLRNRILVVSRVQFPLPLHIRAL